MRSIVFSTALLALALLVGCAGVGVWETSDPLTKLNDASVLSAEQERALIAERLIWESMDIYGKQNDAHGLGHAHREYGTLLRSPAVERWEKFYRENGFRDKTVTFDNRITKSAEYYRKALEYYDGAEEVLAKAGKYDALTNMYYNMAWVHCWLEECEKSCDFFNKSLGAYKENIKRNPSAKPQVSQPYSSLPEQLISEKKRAGCT